MIIKFTIFFLGTAYLKYGIKLMFKDDLITERKIKSKIKYQAINELNFEIGLLPPSERISFRFLPKSNRIQMKKTITNRNRQ
jgi:hypothetical protein